MTMTDALSRVWQTPQRRIWPLLLGMLLYGAVPFLDEQFYSTMLGRNVFPPNGDSIGIPIAFSFAAVLLFAPIFLGLLAVVFIRYVPQTSFSIWRRDRPFWSMAATIGCVGLGLIAINSAWFMARNGFILYALHGLGVAYFLLVARAAFLQGLALS